jgi:ArsR family transcriptional regulator
MLSSGWTDDTEGALGASIIDRMTALADATRGRLLLALERRELTVSELCATLHLPQSTVSRHLKVLGEEGWVVSRADGASNFYRMASPLPTPVKRLWQAVRDQIAELPEAAQDAERLRAVLARRPTRSQEFFTSAAGQWDRVRSELFGGRTELLPLLGLVDPSWTVGDLGCGTGQLTVSLAPLVNRVIAVDESPAMLKAARARVEGLDQVDLRRGELEALPIEDGALDVAIIALVLHYVEEPGVALREAARVLRPEGRLLLVDMMPHERSEYRQTMGHLWQGFSREQVTGWIQDAGLVPGLYHGLAPEATSKGPMLFIVSARKGAGS